MTTEQANGASSPSFSSDGLERFSFGALCELLPADVHWGDLLTPNILSDVAMAVESRVREECADRVATLARRMRGTNKQLARECEILMRSTL